MRDLMLSDLIPRGTTANYGVWEERHASTKRSTPANTFMETGEAVSSLNAHSQQCLCRACLAVHRILWG